MKKYIVKKALPVNGLGEVDTIVLAENFPDVNFTNTEYFMPFPEGAYLIGDYVIFEKLLKSFDKQNLFVVINKGYKASSLVYEIKNVDNGKKHKDVKELDLKKPTFFWFINSDGLVCRDYLERKSIKKMGLEWKKVTGNVFLTKEDAKNYREAAIRLFLNKNK